MKQLQVLGTGCPKCQKLAQVVEKAAHDLGIEFTLEKVTDINDILGFGVMTTPALVVDGEVKVVGRVPGSAELQEILR